MRWLTGNETMMPPSSPPPPSTGSHDPGPAPIDALAPTATPAVALSALESAFPTRLRGLILVVDDDICVRETLCLYLQNRFDVVSAKDGVEGYFTAIAELPDLILSDVSMPVKNGLELCRDLRANAATRDIPIVMLTATKDQDTKLDCLAAGATEFIPKPCSAAELELRVRNLVQMYRQQQELAAHKLRLELAIQELQAKDDLLARQVKLAALGRMSAGLIHEINNPLNYAFQALQLMQQQAPSILPAGSESFAEMLVDVHDGIKRVSGIIAALRNFATPGSKGSYQATELVRVVNHAVKITSTELHLPYKIEVNVPEGLQVFVHEHLMIQVLTNLIRNAADAMAKKAYHGNDAPLLSLYANLCDEMIHLKITDNGVGMPPEVSEHIFDPFFTTKDVGEGMGLGLSVCHAFLTEFGATIEVQSKPGEGTEFTLGFLSHSGKDGGSA